MYPKIKIKVGKGHEPVELQQYIDTDLKTKAKTVPAAINELNDTINVKFNDIDTALDRIIAIENSLIGGDSA